MTSASSARRQLAALDLIRGVAALCVMTLHVSQFFGDPVLPRSYLCVDLFFILSGFVLPYAYGAALRAKTLRPLQFMKLRLIRLYPLFALATLFSAALRCADVLLGSAVGTRWSLSELLASTLSTLLFLPNRVASSSQIFPLNGVLWSLFFELLMSGLYALCHGWFTRPRAFIATGLVGALLAVAAVQHGGLDTGFYWSLESFTLGALRALFGLACGLLLASSIRAPQAGPAGRGHVRGFALAGSSFLLACAVPVRPSLSGALDALIVLALAPWLVWLAADVTFGRRGAKLAQLLGIVSYPLYLLHLPFGKLFAYLLQKCRLPDLLFRPLGAPLMLGSLLALSYALFRWYDEPVRRALTRVLRTRALPTQHDPAVASAHAAAPTREVG